MTALLPLLDQAMGFTEPVLKTLDTVLPTSTPVYYETLPKETVSPIRAEIEKIVPMATLEQGDALERLIDRVTLDKANVIVGRLQKHREGAR